MKTLFTTNALVASAIALVVAGCSSPQGGTYNSYSREVVVSGPPPARQVIVTPPPPRTVVEPPTTVIETPSTVSTRPGYVWIDGNYVWKSNGWEWQEGHWARQPYRNARWVPGHYSAQDGRHIYVPGYWTQ